MKKTIDNACRRVVSLCLILAMLLTLLPAIPLFTEVTANAAATSKTITVYFKNTDGWSSVYGYIWDANGTPVVEWPGTRLSQDSNGLCKLTYTYTPEGTNKFNFIFNNNSGGQTADLTVSNAALSACQQWWVNGPDGQPAKYAVPAVSDGKATFTYEDSGAGQVLLAGSMNNWSGVSMTKSGSTFSYTCDLEPGKYEYKFVTDGNWINDPCNPQTTGSDNNNYIIVSGLRNAVVTATKGVASTLPAELTYVDAGGNEYMTAVTYSVPSGIGDYVTVNGNQITVSSAYTASSVELTAATANGDSATVTVSLASQSQTGTSVKVHFLNNLGWEDVCAYVWENDTALSGWSWPGNAISRDADGYYTLELDYLPTLGEDLGLLFHNNNGSQTADITISDSDLSKGNVELWVQPSTTAGEDGKYSCTVATAESGLFLSPEINGNQVTFRYKNSSASAVYLAGSFNNWSTSANKMTKSNGVWSITLTLDADVYEYKFVVDGEWIHDPNNLATGGFDGNSIVVVPDENAANTGKVTVKLHFYRENGQYTGWDAWMWGDNTGATGCAFADDPSGKGKVATFTVDGNSNTQVGYIIRKTDWSDQEDFGNRFIDISNVVSGTVHYYVTGGVYAGSKIPGPDVVMGPKITYANLDYDSGRIWVKTSLPVSGALSTAFSIVTASGAETDITVSGVSVDNGGYSLTLSRSLALSEISGYAVKFGGCTIAVKTEGLFQSDKFAEDYTYYGDDLGATWTKNATTFKVWAPTALNVQVKLYKSGNYGTDDLIKMVPMTLGEKGVWTATVSGDLHGTYYNYDVTFDGYTVEATDPYADSTGANGDRGMVLNMDATDPEGWDRDVSPNQGMSYTDAIIYEMHVREFTIDASSGVKDEWRGTYLGLTQSGTSYQGHATGLDHLKELGVTHVQLMPVYDFKSLDEYNLDIWEQYAWGYDPKNYNTPDGSYSTDPFNGAVRVNEFKQMVQALHSSGINVVMDVVYNHAYDGGNFCYNQIVPNYFSRFWGEEIWDNASNGSYCGNDMATEREMARIYIVDSIMHWVEEYHIDGFRFDLMGLIDTQTMNEIVDAVHAKYPYVMFYGEGWNKDGSTAVESGYTLANMGNAWATPGLGFYNDGFRNSIAGDNGNSWGFASGDTGKADAIASYFRASNDWDGEGSYIPTPTQTVNYVSCHDNYSLMDKLCISRNGAYWEELVRMNNLSAAIYLMAQGVPMVYSGEELLREKKDASGNRYDNAYGTDDYVNKIRWSELVSKDYAQVTDDYYAGLIEFRKNHAALRNSSGADAWNYVTYHKINDQTILFYVSGYPNYECSDGIVIIYNASDSTQWVDLYDKIPQGYWQACVHGDQAGVNALWGMEVTGSSGNVGVEARSATILVLGDLVDENSVYNRQNLDCSHSSHNTDGKCTNCGTAMRHSYEDGKCTVCGVTCSHNWSGILCTTCGDVCDHDWSDGTCATCGMVCAHSYQSGVCVLCGQDKPVMDLDYYLFGYINGADYGNDGLGEYKFVDGKLTVTFDQDSYVAVKASDYVSTYMTNGYLGENVTSAVLYNTEMDIQADKLYVPGGKEITFTLSYNGDDTFTLSYVTAEDSADRSYYLAGTMNSWAEKNADYQLEQDGDVYKITVALATGTHEFKITDGTWDNAWPSSNYVLDIPADSNVTITFNPVTCEITVDGIEDAPVVRDSKDIKWQVTSGTGADSASTNLRLVSWVDSVANYSSVTFNVTINGATAPLVCTTAYTAIKASGVNITNPAGVFGEETANYFVTYTIKGIPASLFDSEILVTVTWTDLEGNSVTSDVEAILISSDWT